MVVEEDRSLLRILVGFDGSDQATRALDLAVAIAAQRGGAEIHIGYVVQRPTGAPDPVPQEVMNSLKAAARVKLLDAERRVTERLATPVIHLMMGNPGERLLELAERVKPDLVVLGTLQHSMSDRLLGTVSSFFIRSRRYPLLIVP
jgi:nucleotide-binding universal stress UspA family protein